MESERPQKKKEARVSVSVDWVAGACAPAGTVSAGDAVFRGHIVGSVGGWLVEKGGTSKGGDVDGYLVIPHGAF